MEEKRLKGREMAKALLLKSSKNLGPNGVNDKSLHSSRTESTVNENDFQKYIHTDMVGKLDELSQILPEMSNLEKSIVQIFAEHAIKSKLGNVCNSTTIEEFDSAMFMTADLAADKLKNDEDSWRKKHNMPAKIDSSFSLIEATQDEKCSIGEIFATKSNECPSYFYKKSPERRTPIALIESGMDQMSVSNISNITNSDFSISHTTKRDESILSLSKIRDAIAEADGSTPNKIISRLIGNTKIKPLKENAKKNISSNSNRNSSTVNRNSIYDRDPKSYFSTSNLFCNATDDDVLQHAKLVKTTSLESISDKENIADNNIDKSLASVKSSSSSISALPDGKLAIECTKTELVFGCIKLGKSQTEHVTIRNKFQQKLRFQVLCTNQNFKISKIDADVVSEVSVLLYPMETRQFTIIFTPTSVGAHIGKLHFNPIIKGVAEKNNQQKMKMYGYGGHSSISFEGASLLYNTKGSLLSIGFIQNQSLLSTTFSIKNSGTLSGFASITVLPKTVNNFKDIEITPCDVSIKAGEKVSITVTYTPSKQDFRCLRSKQSESNVRQIAQLKVITGSDVTRARLRRLQNIIKHNNLSVDSVIEQLSKAYKNECMPKDVTLFTESVGASSKLLQQNIQLEIDVTVGYDNDMTLVPGMSMCETSSFKTLKQIGCDMTENEHMPNESEPDGLKVLPSQVMLTPPHKVDDSILFTSECCSKLGFEIKMEPEGVIAVNPRRGVINCGETVILKISCPKMDIINDLNVNMFIHTDFGVLDIVISIINVGHLNF